MGLSKAIEMMLASLNLAIMLLILSFFLSWFHSTYFILQLSKFVSGTEGKNLGLIDELVSSSELLRVSRLWALDIADKRKPWVSSLRRTDRIGSLSEARMIIKEARQLSKRIAPNMPQHNACLDVIEEGVLFGGYAGSIRVRISFMQIIFVVYIYFHLSI